MVSAEESNSDNESEQSSSTSTASSIIADGRELCARSKGKIILRKAKLKVKSDLPVIGPFSSGMWNIKILF